MNFGTKVEMEKNSVALDCMGSKAAPNHPSVNKEGSFPRHAECKTASIPTAAPEKQKWAISGYKSRRVLL
jgi:hypothetical protein